MLNRSKTGRLRLPRPNSERDAPSWALADPLSGDGGAAPDSPARASSDPKLLQKKRAQRTESVHEVRTGWGDDLVADYRILFDEIDIDHSGLIDAFELEKVFKKLELRFSRRKVQEMINSVDCTGDGEIDFEEFLTLLFKLHDPKARSWNLTVVFDYTEFTKPCLQQVRSDVWDALDDPSSSTCARVLTISIISVILLSTFLIVLQSIPEYYADENGVFFALEFACGVAFSLEFFVRCLTTPNCGQFVSGFMNWIDLLSIIPFWGEIIIMAMNNNMAEGVEMIDARDVEFLVAMRAFRVFRVLKVSRYVTWVNIFTQALSRSASALLTVLYIIMVMVLVLSAIMFYMENDRWDPTCGGGNHPDTGIYGCYLREDGQKSRFSSIPVCIWWCMITISTIGFGDLIPQTGVGKLLCSFAAVSGVIILAVPISIVSANFQDVFRRFRQRVWLEKRRNQIKNEVTEVSFKRARAANSDDESEQADSPTAKAAADNLNASEKVLFATYEDKYLETLSSMCQKNNRRFGYGLEIEGSANRATLIDSLHQELQRHEVANAIEHEDAVERVVAKYFTSNASK